MCRVDLSQPVGPELKWTSSHFSLFSFVLDFQQITKPLLERQRRARINRCLDELKELMSAALAAEGENLTKLEKADVLELTVRHLHQLHREGELSLNGGLFNNNNNRPPSSASSAAPADRRRYQGGFLACAQQVASYVMKTPGLEPGLGQRLLAHLARCSQQLSPDANGVQPVLGLAGLPPLPPAEANFVAAAFPSLTLPVDYHASTAREYSITAQFQVYRPPVAPQPLRINPDDVPMIHPAESGSSDESVSPGSKRRASPDFPHIPKKRYAHFNFNGSNNDEPLRIRTESESEPVASTSTASSHPSSECYVVESQIVQLSPSSTSTDGKDADSMWRPW